MQKEDKPYKIEKFEGRQSASVFVQSIFVPVLVQLVFILMLSALVQTDNIDEYTKTNPWIDWVLTILIQLSFLGIFIFFTRRKNIDGIAAAKINKKVTPIQVLIFVGIAVTVLFVFDPLVILFDEFIKLLGYKTPEFVLGEINTWGTYIGGIFALCVLPAICEELIFRGVLTNGLAGYGKKTAVLMTGLCFSLMHQNPDQTVHQFLLGCLLGWVLLETDSFWSVSLIHFFNNFIVLTVEFFTVSTGIELFAWTVGSTFVETLFIRIGISLVLGAALYGLLYALRKTAKKEPAVGLAEEKIPVPSFKMPFADVLTPGGRGDEDKIKIVESVYKKQVEEWSGAGKAREKKAALYTLLLGLGFCFVMWLYSFFLGVK